MEILTIQKYFLGHMEAYQDSQTSFLITQLNSISPLLSLKKKVSTIIDSLLHCTVAVHHMTCQKGHHLPWYDTGHI